MRVGVASEFSSIPHPLAMPLLKAGFTSAECKKGKHIALQVAIHP
jgi:hypothetical protein